MHYQHVYCSIVSLSYNLRSKTEKIYFHVFQLIYDLKIESQNSCHKHFEDTPCFEIQKHSNNNNNNNPTLLEQK